MVALAVSAERLVVMIQGFGRTAPHFLAAIAI
jgi:hypothetical protein